MTDFLQTDPFNLTSEEVKDLIYRDPGERNEFISNISQDQELAVTAGAMANIGGGYITIGVSKSGEIVGVTDPAAIDEMVQFEIFEYIERPSDLLLRKTSCEIDGKNIVVIKIDEFDDLPVAVDGRFYERAGRQNNVLTPPDVRDIMKESISD